MDAIQSIVVSERVQKNLNFVDHMMNNVKYRSDSKILNSAIKKKRCKNDLKQA